MSSPTNVLYLGIRVEDRDANRSIADLNRKLDGVGDHGKKGGDQASRAMENLAESLRTAAKVPPPPIPTERLRQLNLEMQRFKRESSNAFSGFTADSARMQGSLLGLAKSVGGPIAAFFGLKAAASLALDTAQFAARTEQLGFALNAVARASNLSEEAVSRQVTQIQKLGFTLQSSRQQMARLIAANIDYRKATELARLSQDLGRIAGINSVEAYERLTHAIVTLQPEMLRTLGLTVSLERSYRQYAKSLGKSTDDMTEFEKRQVAVNAVLKAGASFQGVYEESAKTAGGQVLSMQRYFDDLTQAVGERFLPAYTGLVTFTADSLKVIKENIGLLDQWMVHWNLLLAPLRTATGVFSELIDFVKEYNSIQPRTLDANNLNDKNQIDRRTAYARAQQASFFNGFGAGLSGFFTDVKELQATASQSMQQTLAKKAQSAKAASDAARSQYEATVAAAEEETEKKRKEFATKAQQAVEQSRGMLEKAQLSELQGLERINRERQIALRDLGLTAEAVRNINAAFDIEVQQANLRGLQEWAKIAADGQQAQAKQTGEFLKVQLDALRRRLDFEREIQVYQLRREEEVLRAEEVTLRNQKELRLAQLEVVSRNDLQGKIALEDAKLKIETEYLQRSVELAEAASRKKAEIEIQTNPRFREEIEAGLQERIAEIRRNAAADQQLSEQRAVNTQQEIVLRAWEDTYDQMKRGAESVFDALTARSKSFGEYLKTGMLTILREIVSSQFARMYMSMFGGGGGQPSPGAQRGGGGLGALLGLPGIGGMGSVGLPGAPGGTGGFSGPVGGFGNNGIGSLFGIGSFGRVGSTPSATAGAGAQGGWRGMLSAQGGGFKGLLSSLGGLGSKSTTVFDEMGQATTFSKGIGGMGGGAMLLGGGALAAAGLYRGGWTGLGMTAAGGALIGAKFGGPIGAAIGGAVGAGAGLIRMLFKGAEKKTAEKIKAIYGLDVKDKGILRQVVEAAKQSYGGNTDVAIRSPQIRDLLELYAMSTGQKFGLNANTVRPSSIVQSGGQIFQQVAYDMGRAYTQQSSLPTLGGGNQVVQIVINGQSAAAALQGEAVQAIVQNPRAVQSATVAAQRNNFQRREVSVRGLRPQLITA